VGNDVGTRLLRVCRRTDINSSYSRVAILLIRAISCSKNRGMTTRWLPPVSCIYEHYAYDNDCITVFCEIFQRQIRGIYRMPRGFSETENQETRDTLCCIMLHNVAERRTESRTLIHRSKIRSRLKVKNVDRSSFRSFPFGYARSHSGGFDSIKRYP